MAQDTTNKKRQKICGYEVDFFNFNEAAAYVLSCLKNESPCCQVVTINPEMIELAQKNKNFSAVLKNAQLVIPDGIGIKLGFMLKGQKIKRITGIEFSYELLKKCAELNYPVAIIGTQKETLHIACNNLKNKIPNLNLAYFRDGFFNEEDEAEIIKNLISSKAKLVLVGLGIPKQELFIAKYKEMFNGAAFIGIGGSLDVWSGKIKRAPKLFQILGIEWLYRVVTQPERIKRIFPALPLFLFRVIMDSRD